MNQLTHNSSTLYKYKVLEWTPGIDYMYHANIEYLVLISSSTSCCIFYSSNVISFLIELMFNIRNVTYNNSSAELAQSVERTTLNRVVVGSIPTFGEILLLHYFFSSLRNHPSTLNEFQVQ